MPGFRIVDLGKMVILGGSFRDEFRELGEDALGLGAGIFFIRARKKFLHCGKKLTDPGKNFRKIF